MDRAGGRLFITGGSGFLGQHLVRRLLDEGHVCVSLDLEPHEIRHDNLLAIQGDIRDRDLLARTFREHHFDAVLHCASAVVAHAVRGDRDFVRTTNVDGTRNIAELARQHSVRKVVFISTCVLWKHGLGRPVVEDDVPDPGEVYGWTKWDAEKILLAEDAGIEAVVLRSPTVIDTGRLGLLSILFEFIEEGRKVWVIGAGGNRHQFVSGEDLVDACLRSLSHAGGGIFNVGADNVKPLRDVYQHVIDRARTGARVAHLPRAATLAAMRLAFKLGVSPLGPYQYRMIAEDFIFDTTKITQQMGWQSTSTNEEMLYRAYEFYRSNREELRTRTDLSAHRQPAKLGAIRLLKWMS
jgi:nucleoside-diphosphate-sugar epimerase